MLATLDTKLELLLEDYAAHKDADWHGRAGRAHARTEAQMEELERRIERLEPMSR